MIYTLFSPPRVHTRSQNTLHNSHRIHIPPSEIRAGTSLPCATYASSGHKRCFC